MNSTFQSPPLFKNGQLVPLRDIPLLDIDELRQFLIQTTSGACRLSALFGVPQGDQVRLYAISSSSQIGSLQAVACDVGNQYPALTRDVPQAHWFEREIAEQWGIVPEGHPWLKPIRFHPSYRPGHDAWGRAVGETILPCVTDYFRVEGEEVHEVAVGPVHAGVIEPGHFRFQCHGEFVYHLEIELGYQHRGIEKQLVGGPNKRTLHYMETLSGDTSVGHATAYCQALEGLAGVEAPLKAQAIRAFGLELERLANHTGDLGALAGDVGFLPTLAYCGALRGDFLNASAVICGNRFGRSLVRPGGVRWDIEATRAEDLIKRVQKGLEGVASAVKLLWGSTMVLARFEECGHVTKENCDALGLVGMAARACGTDRDIRRDFPSGFWRTAQLPIAKSTSCDVYARASIRWQEVESSCNFLLAQLKTVPSGPTCVEMGNLKANSLVVSLVEGWRGEICHVAITNDQGKFAHYKVVDPSFHNWIGLALALRNQQISDFPLNNKSFNLSYCGHDL